MILEIILLIGLILLSILFSNGKGSFLIAGFNTMSRSEKDKYNKSALCRFMGKITLIVAFAMAMFIVSDI